MFLNDSPLEQTEQDSLGRDSLAYKITEAIRKYDSEECLTIGIYGGWGEGKTSLANMILGELSKINSENEPKYCYIKFNPWLFSNQKDLITQLFTSISEVFKYSDPNGVKNRSADVIAVLSKAAKCASYIHPSISSIAKDISKRFEDYSKLLKGESTGQSDYETLTQLKYKISETSIIDMIVKNFFFIFVSFVFNVDSCCQPTSVVF